MKTSTKPLTILQVTPALAEGGVEQSTLEMASYIKAHGATPIVASAGGAGEAILRHLDVEHVAMSLDHKAPWFVLWNMIRLRALIRSRGIDIVHARSRGPAWAAWLALRGRDFSRVKFITTFHGTYGAGNRFKRFYNKVMLKGPLVIANSDFIRQHIVETYNVPSSRIVVAARGIEPSAFHPERYSGVAVKRLRAELDIPDEMPMLLMVGRITHWKGHHVLLDALAKVKDLPWTMVFVGGETQPSYANDLKRQAKWLGIAERIRWAGSRKDIPLLNLAADVAFSCSVRPEAFGRVSIEAQAMGTPVIASALGGSLETVRDGETGWLVPPEDEDALAKAIRTALASPEKRTAMGKAARAWVLGHFTTDTCCKAEWSAYQKLVGKKPQGGT